MRIVSVGECMVEMAPQGDAGSYGMSFAGDTFNTAWYLARQRPDWRVDYLTAVGMDAVSDQLLAFMQDAGIGTDHVQRNPDRTVGLYMISLDNGERSFAYWRSHAAARLLADDPAALAKGLAGADVVFFSGITIAVIGAAGRATLFAALQDARDAGAQVVFDTNIRPKLWADAQEMRDAMMQAAAVSDIVLPSHDEEALHFGDASPRATLDRYAACGPATIVVKNGAESVLYRAHGAMGEVTPVKVASVVDTTAAGDSFDAGFLAVYAENGDAEAAIRNGCALSAQVIAGRGALVPTTLTR